jgi:hypothetical protein
MSRREAMYKADRIGERGEPCSIPLWTAHGAEMCIPIFRDTVLPVRKEWIQSHTYIGKPFRQNTCVVCSGLTVSKKLVMLKRKRAPACPVRCVAWMWWTRVATASMVLWWGHEPNCDMERRLAC